MSTPQATAPTGYSPSHMDTNTLSCRMMQQAHELHMKAEAHSVTQAIIQGTVTDKEYASYLANYYLIFEALEKLKGSVPGQLSNSCFNRTIGIQTDLQKVYPQSSFEAYATLHTQATKKYVHYLESISHLPHLLLAHCYVHYLGIMAGGQIQSAKITTKWPEAVSLYDFATSCSSCSVANTFALRGKIKDELNARQYTGTQQQEMIQEAKAAFQYTYNVFEDIASQHHAGQSSSSDY